MVLAITLADAHHLERITECQQIQELKKTGSNNLEPDRNSQHLHPQNKCVHTNRSYLAQTECVKVKAYQRSKHSSQLRYLKLEDLISNIF